MGVLRLKEFSFCAKQQPKRACMAKTVMWAPAEAPVDGAESVQQAKRLSAARTRRPSCHGNRRETVLEARRLNASRHNSKRADAVNQCAAQAAAALQPTLKPPLGLLAQLVI